MADRVYPATKPNPPPAMNGGGGAGATTTAAPPTANGGGGGVGSNPPTKPNPYNNNNGTRPIARPYRPQNPPPRRNSRKRCCSPRKCCCLCFIYTLIFLLSLLLLAAIAACIFYFLYHPKHPTFTVTTAKISNFNLSSDTSFSHLDSKIDFTLTAKNPNKKIYFFYDPMLIAASAASVDAGNATIPAFQHSPGNTTIIHATMTSDVRSDLDSDTVGTLKSDLAKKSGSFPVTIQVDTKVKVKMGKLVSNRVGIRVTCDGIKGFVPKKVTTKGTKKMKKGGTKIVPVMAVTTDAKCKVDLRIKIWKFTF